MRRRLLVTYLSLLAAVLLGISVPFAAILAADATRTAYIDRQKDTARFASISEPAINTGRVSPLQAELAQHEQLYGITAAIVDRDERVVLASRSGVDLDQEPQLRSRVQAALSGVRAGAGDVVWPWRATPLIVTEPVTSNGEIIGVAVTISPTEDLRWHVLQRWGLLLLAVLLATAAGIAPGLRIIRWILRPINQLDEVTHAIAAGRLEARVATDSGPPELRRLGASFNTMADSTAALLEQQRTFVSHASHQLRTPLATLRLRVETLADHLAPGAESAHELTLSEVDRLNGVCHELLTLARNESGGLQRVHVDAGAVADDRVAAWQPVAAAHQIGLRREGDPVAMVVATVGAVDHALDALIDNAIKFAEPGCAVLVDVRAAGTGWVLIRVVDDGPGLPEPELELAIRPFWRASAVQNIDGSGLGLPIVASLVRASEGEFAVHQNHPRGLDVRLRLRAADPDAEDPGAAPRGEHRQRAHRGDDVNESDE